MSCFYLLTKTKVMEKQTVFKTVNEDAAGIDIGAAQIFVSIDGNEVKSFDTFTSDYYQCAEYLIQAGIRKVAMEATGVYWIALYSILEAKGLKVSLVNPKETKQVKGRKTDVQDGRWIQKLFSAGILRSSFIPEGKYMEIRQLVRERSDLIEMGSIYVNKMQKALELMNIKLTEVISQIQGVSGMKIIKAILSGHRDTDFLISLCDKRIRDTKSEQVGKSLQGNYNETYLFMLKSNMEMWEMHQQQVETIDSEIEKLLDQLCAGKPHTAVTSKPKSIRHHAPAINDLHYKMVQLHGANISSIAGINDSTLLRLVGETGADMSRFPTRKHFISWLGLSPRRNDSGKSKKRVKASGCNKAGQIFKESAQGLLNSKHIAIGSFMRKLKVRKDTPIAIKAGARKIAEAYYDALTKGCEYVEQGVKKYEQLIIQREKNALYRLAKKHNIQLVESKPAA
jgi:transposase